MPGACHRVRPPGGREADGTFSHTTARYRAPHSFWRRRPATAVATRYRNKLDLLKLRGATSGTKLATHAQNGLIWQVLPEQGELYTAAASNEPTRANFFARRTRRRGDCETTITTAHPQTATTETGGTTATEKRTKYTHFSPAKATPVSVEALPTRAKAMAVSVEALPTRAKATMVSTGPPHQPARAPPVWRGPEGQAAAPVGGGGAWPGFETTDGTPGSTGVEGAGGTCRGAGGRWRGLAGLRADAPSKARSADGERAGRRPPAHTAAGPTRRPEHQRGNKHHRTSGGDQQELLAREAVDLMHDEATHRAHPCDGCDAEDARTPGPDLQEVLETVSGPGGCG